ncbi:retrotransposon hot spot (RHS) protein, putative [Trypanosoma brucei brucei TREU927]|uniref:Retrotransposon hot spot (RHS) protein, putative n=1 Tax=Trypanosoma brucei brucei (strain 927/4 GUTat10.1) TaxID=185431 RepID=Q584M5_TRYB2|nr:retrotransposon hot spot (RHS) protein, putative [Trypanosoma brucei brucei TREU927]AAQ15533.1 retrotransposon hot spot (RHS) protein, putative [Trypanosoma brucei brucei TREU927]AAX80415.1 retrotransposon hot spot (RHS) protein, putative [Trypanosoma brucei]
MSRANSPAAPQGNNENQQVADNIEAAMRRPRDENVPPPAAAAAQPPQIRQRTEEGPNWTMNSSIEDVLLQRYEGLRDMTLHDFLLKKFFNTYDTENVAMDVFVQSPEDYILDAGILGRIRRLYQFEEYKELYNQFSEMKRKARYLDEKEIYYLSQWEEKGRGEIREFVGPMARGRLDGALEVAKRAEKRAAQTAGGAVELEGVYESIYNAKWSYVMSGYNEEPLGMKVFDGKPQCIWTEAEVDITPDPANVDAEIEERPDGLEIFVLTSEKGWPYNGFALDDAEICLENFKHVYIRREIMRVWYIIQRGLQGRWVEKAEITPRHIVIGTPGIGKSYGVGSFLLHSLLHFNDGMLDVVAYFVGKIAYLIYNKKPGEGGKVEQYEDVKAAVRVIAALVFKKKKGHIIVDICKNAQTPPDGLPVHAWGVTLLTSPDEAHFHHWSKDKRDVGIIINCDDVRDMKAFVAWTKLSVASGYAALDEEAQARIVEELKNEWETIKSRINVVGPVPRCVYNSAGYTKRVSQAKKMITSINGDNKSHYEDIMGKIADWRNDKVTHRLVKIVRVRDAGESVDEYRCRPLSVCIGNAIFFKLLAIDVEKMAIRQVTMSDESAAANVFESRALLSLLFPRVFKVIADNLKYLRRGGEIADRRSILNDMAPQQLKLTGQKALPAAHQRPIDNCEYMVLYRPATGNEPVVDGFFFVEGRLRRAPDGAAPPTTPNIAVLLQVTKSDRHPTTTDKVQKFRENMARYFSDWGAFSRDMVWEMIYINSVNGGTITIRQLCDGDDPAEAADMWRNMAQYQVTLREEMQGQLMRAYRDECWYRDAPLLAMEPAPQPRNEQAGAQGG